MCIVYASKHQSKILGNKSDSDFTVPDSQTRGQQRILEIQGGHPAHVMLRMVRSWKIGKISHGCVACEE